MAKKAKLSQGNEIVDNYYSRTFEKKETKNKEGVNIPSLTRKCWGGAIDNKNAEKARGFSRQS